MSKNADDIICNCMQITRGEIIDSILSDGKVTVEAIGEITEAGTVCGSCHEDIQNIIDETIVK